MLEDMNNCSNVTGLSLTTFQVSSSLPLSMIALEELVGDRNVCHKASTVNGKKTSDCSDSKERGCAKRKQLGVLLGTALVLCDNSLVK